MASKTIKGAFHVKLSNQEGYDHLLARKNIQCLVDSDGCEIHTYADLVDGGVYTAGPELVEAKTG